jgi:hypothetical protein
VRSSHGDSSRPRSARSRIFLFPLLLLFLLNLLMPTAISVDGVSRLNYYLTGLLRLIQGLCAVRRAACSRRSTSSSRFVWCRSNSGLCFPGVARHRRQLVSAQRTRPHGRLHLLRLSSERAHRPSTELARSGLYAGPVIGFFLGGILTKYSGHFSIYYASGRRTDLPSSSSANTTISFRSFFSFSPIE